MNISFLGGAAEVGASCILVKIDGRNILMDSGIRQGGNKDTLPDFRTIQEKGGVDGIIISHAHMDHIGSLPIIAKEYPLAKIYCNNMTKDLMRVLLYDSLRIMNSREVEIPFYSEKDVLEILNRTYTYNFEKTFKVLQDIECTFYMAGHIPGASVIYLSSKEGSVFYSGDFSLFSQIAVDGAKFPKLRPDVAIVESTYGDKLHANRKVEEERLVSLINEAIMGSGKVLIPAFALGRSQEVILILKKAINKGEIPPCKIYIDGMVRDINRVFKNNPLYLKNSLCKKILKGIEPFYDENIVAISRDMKREDILKLKESCIIITSSGMLSGGPSQFYAETLLSDEKASIIISGYQDEESPGRKVLNLYESEEQDKKFEINGRIIPVKCRIEKVSLSAHGDKSEIKAINDRLNPKELFLVHGDKEVIDSLAKEVSCSFSQKVYVPRVGESYDVNIRTPRKQLKKMHPHKMGNELEITREDLKDLRDFVINNYGIRAFTLEDLLIIWGEKSYKEEELCKYQDIFINGPYFSNDEKRVFMYVPASEEDVLRNIKKGELNQTDVKNIISEKLAGFDVKKISLLISEKKVILSFDFPKVLNDSIFKEIKELEDNLNWKIEIKEQTNMAILDGYIREVLGFDNVNKISHNISNSEVVVKLYNEMDISVFKEEFYEKTGFRIFLKDELREEVENEVAITNNIFEQNRLISLIEVNFSTAKYKPYKKSIIRNGLMKLAFITPKAGHTNDELIKFIEKESGWSIEVLESYNQNELLSLTEREARALGLVLSKRPAFLPEQNVIKVNFAGVVDEDSFNELANIIRDKAMIECIK